MTLQEWADLHNKYIVEHHGAYWVPDTMHFDARRQLWDLSDYRVTSVVGGVIWLCPTKKPIISFSVERWNEAGDQIEVDLLDNLDDALQLAKQVADSAPAVAIFVRADYGPQTFDYADEPCYKLGIREALQRILS